MSNKRVSFRAEDEFRKELSKILEDINSKREPYQRKYTVKDIVWEFMDEYTKTNPYGLINENKRLKKRIDDINKEIEELEKEKNKITAQIEVNDNTINCKKLDDFKEDYTKRVNEAKKDFEKRYNNFKNKMTPQKTENLLKTVCNTREIKPEDLKEIL